MKDETKPTVKDGVYSCPVCGDWQGGDAEAERVWLAAHDLSVDQPDDGKIPPTRHPNDWREL